MMLASLDRRQQLLNAANTLRLMQVGYEQTLKTCPEYQRRETCSVGRGVAVMAPCVVAFLRSENKVVIQKNRAAAGFVVELFIDFYNFFYNVGCSLLNSRSKTPLRLNYI